MKENNSILFVANWESDVGYAWWLMEGFWLTISEHLQIRKINSYLVYPKITKLSDKISQSKITTKELDFKDTTLKGIFNTAQFIKKYRIRYLYLTDSRSHSLFYVLLHLIGVREIIIHEHTPGERSVPKGIKKYIKIILHRIPFYTADYYIAVTKFIYNRLVNVSCIPYTKCFVAQNGIQPIDVENSDKRYTQKKFNIPPEKIIVVTTGRATYYKGIDFFIECANEIINKRENHNFHFLICGDGPDLESFKSLVYSYNLSEHVTFAGKRNDIRQILPSCNIGFHSSVGEVGYSLSTLEYMSASLLTVVPDNPSTSLATKHKITGYLYNRSSITSAVNAIFEAAKDTPNNEIIRNTAKNFVDKELTIEHTHEELKRIIEKIIST